jgi:hypothetical protein
MRRTIRRSRSEPGSRCSNANVNSVDNERTDRIFFRRLRPYIAGTITKNWWGVIAIEFGENLNENELQVKDAYIRTTGGRTRECG